MTDFIVADLGYISCLNTITGTLVFVLLFSEINLRTYRILEVSAAQYLVINAAKQTAGSDNESLRYTQHVCHFLLKCPSAEIVS